MSIYDEIQTERKRQDKLWGGPAHDDHHSTTDWARFISDRCAKLRDGEKTLTTQQVWDLFVHIAALAVAALNQIERQDARR